MMNMMPARSRPVLDLEVVRFGEFLVEHGVIDRRQLLQALMAHHLHGDRIGVHVARLGFAPVARIERLAAKYHAL